MNMLNANSQNFMNASLVAGSCSGSNYELGPITYFLEKDPKIASKIRQFQSERGNNNQINVDFFVSNIPNEKLINYIKAKDQSKQAQSGYQSQINDKMAMMDGMMNANPMMRSLVGGPMKKQRKKAQNDSFEKSIFPFGSKYGQFNLFKLYVDAGNVWGVDYSNAVGDSSHIRSSTGVGLEWFSPIGPFTFTLAQPISKIDTDQTQSFQFNIGTTF